MSETLIRRTVVCTSCQGVHSIGATADQWNRYDSNREHVQTVFPELSADTREMLISGTCGTCWDAMFPEDAD